MTNMKNNELFPLITGGATFDDSRKYRYRLWREWDCSKGRLLWIMLNPSTADETVLDPTIRRCVGFSKRWGYGGVEIVNLFAIRSTNPKVLRFHHDPIGPENDAAISECVRRAPAVIAAWGANKAVFCREKWVRRLIRHNQRGCCPVMCLGMTFRDYQPKHPLYVRSNTDPVAFL